MMRIEDLCHPSTGFRLQHARLIRVHRPRRSATLLFLALSAFAIAFILIAAMLFGP